MTRTITTTFLRVYKERMLRKRQLPKSTLILYPISHNVEEVITEYWNNGEYKIIRFTEPYDIFINEFTKFQKYDKFLFTCLRDYNLIMPLLLPSVRTIILETWGFDTCQLVESNGITQIIKLEDKLSEINIIKIPITPTNDLLRDLMLEDDPEVKKLLTVYDYSSDIGELPDKPIEYGGWIPEQLQLSPKIEALIQNLKSGKSIVLSKYDDKYGTMLIKSILYRHGFNITSNIDVYNDQEDIILCISEVPKDIIGLDEIHVMDNYDHCIINKIIRHGTNISENLSIYMYPMINTIDYRTCECLNNKLISYNQSYKELFDHATIW